MSIHSLLQAPSQPFLDWLVVTNPRDWLADVALLGVRHSEPYAHDPDDQAGAPDAIRVHSDRASYGRGRWDFDLADTLGSLAPVRAIDCGNMSWDGGSYDEFFASVSAKARDLWSRGTQLFVLGGDHGVTIPMLDALEVLGEPIHLLQIDAHLDWREEIGGVRRGYSSPMRWAGAKPYIRGMTQVGMRLTGSAGRQEVSAARAYGSHIFPAHEVIQHGWSRVIASIPAASALYISIDADGVDPTEMPGVMAPSPGGFLYRELAPVLRQMAQQHRVVGMDVVEVAPTYDSPNGITCVMAGRLVVDVLAASWGPGGACRRRQVQNSA